MLEYIVKLKLVATYYVEAYSPEEAIEMAKLRDVSDYDDLEPAGRREEYTVKEVRDA